MSSSAIRIALVLAALVILIVAGALIGSLLRPAGPMGLAPSGSLMEVHLTDGTVYLGDLVGDEDGYLRLDAPAVVVPEAVEDNRPSYRVTPLSSDPYGLIGPVIIPREQTTMIGAVAAGSGIEGAYLDAMSGAEPSPSAESS